MCVEWHSTGLNEAQRNSEETQALIVDFGNTYIKYTVDSGGGYTFQINKASFFGILKIIIMN